MLEIWIDGDACPTPIKEVIYKAALRTKTLVNFVANRAQALPRSPLIKMIVVEQRLDSADEFIVKHIKEKDIVITADILFAEAALKRNAFVISPRGELFSESNIADKVASQSLMSQLRSLDPSAGGGQAPFSLQDKKAFSDHFDRILQKSLRRK